LTTLDKAPGHWRQTTIGEIAEVAGGIQKQPSRLPRSNTAPFLRVANVQRGSLDLTDVHRIELFEGELPRFRLRRGDLLVVEGNGSIQHIGRSALWTGEIADCVHQNHLIRVRPGPEVLPEFLNHYWNSPVAVEVVRDAAQTTSGLYTLSTGKVRSVPVAVPPLDEQRAIVESIERMLSHLGVAEADLVRTRARFATLRDAITAAAMRGDPIGEPYGDAGVELLRVNETLKGRQDKVGPQAAPASLPAGWAWVTLQTAVGEGGLIADGDWVETKDQDPTGNIRLLQLSDVGRGVFRNRSERFINEAAAARLGVTDVQTGDVLVSRLGDPPGDATLVPNLGQRAITSVDVCIVRPAAGAVSAEWLMWCCNSPRFRASVVQHQSGTTRKRISRSKLEQLCVPVPPLAQQRLLIDWIASQTARVARLEAAVEAGAHQLRALRRSILKAAFEGRLTRTDAAPSADDLQEAIA
jgi:type I restriction enzyme, S subunit